MNNNQHPNAGFLFVVYESPHIYQPEAVWEEIRLSSTTIFGPWCVAGDFQQDVFDHEKQEGGPVNSNGRATFSAH